MKMMLPRNDELPASTYEAKKLVCPIGLDVQKIHACRNDCILYRVEEYENLDACPVCTALRYKIRRDDSGDVEGASQEKGSYQGDVVCYYNTTVATFVQKQRACQVVAMAQRRGSTQSYTYMIYNHHTQP